MDFCTVSRRAKVGVVVVVWMFFATVVHGQERVTASYTTSCSDDQDIRFDKDWTLKCSFTNFDRTAATSISWNRNSVPQLVYDPSADAVTGGSQRLNVKKIDSSSNFYLAITLKSFSTEDKDTWECEAEVGANLTVVDSFDISSTEKCHQCGSWGALIGVSCGALVGTIATILQACCGGVRCCCKKDDYYGQKCRCCACWMCCHGFWHDLTRWESTVLFWFMVQYLCAGGLIANFILAAYSDTCDFDSTLGTVGWIMACVSMGLWVLLSLLFFVTFDRSQQRGDERCSAFLALLAFMIMMPVLALLEMVISCCADSKKYSIVRLIIGRSANNKGQSYSA